MSGTVQRDRLVSAYVFGNVSGVTGEEFEWQNYFIKYLSLGRLSFLQASCSTSVRYVPGVTLTVTRRRSVAMTTTCDAMVGRMVRVETAERINNDEGQVSKLFGWTREVELCSHAEGLVLILSGRR